LYNPSCREIEAAIGIEVYGVSTVGVGGVVKLIPDDFTVVEVIEGGLDSQVLWGLGALPMEPARLALWILMKRDRETIPTLSELAKMIGTPPSELRICGIKDRRAVTFQFVAAPIVGTPAAVTRISGRGFEARRVGFIDDLDSSRLAANRFEVIIRDASFSEDIIESFRAIVMKQGVPNFYGHQRFGLMRPVTHLVGRAIVGGELREAVETFLGYSTEFEPEHVREARRLYSETRDPEEALRVFPKKLVYERCILRHLSSNPDGYLGALRKLPLRMRRLFVEAYSAYLFNKAVSDMIMEGLSLHDPLPGDVFVRLDRLGRPYGRPLPVTPSNASEVKRRIGEGELVLALPSPGYLSWIPRSPRGEALRRVMYEEGVSTRSFKLKSLPEASTAGDYRPLTFRPHKLSIEPVNSDTLKLSLSLPPSCYATSLLRELMRRGCALAYIGKRHCYA